MRSGGTDTVLLQENSEQTGSAKPSFNFCSCTDILDFPVKPVYILRIIFPLCIKKKACEAKFAMNFENYWTKKLNVLSNRTRGSGHIYVFVTANSTN